MQTFELRQTRLEQVRTAAAQFVLEHFGDRLSVGVPTPGADLPSQVWTAPIEVDVGGQKRPVGKIKVDTGTNKIVDPPSAQEVHNRVRTVQYST